MVSVILRICTADCKCLYTYIYIYRNKIMNDAEDYVELLRWREKEHERGRGMLLRVAQSRRVIKVALCM